MDFAPSPPAAALDGGAPPGRQNRRLSARCWAMGRSQGAARRTRPRQKNLNKLQKMHDAPKVDLLNLLQIVRESHMELQTVSERKTGAAARSLKNVVRERIGAAVRLPRLTKLHWRAKASWSRSRKLASGLSVWTRPNSGLTVDE